MLMHTTNIKEENGLTRDLCVMCCAVPCSVVLVSLCYFVFRSFVLSFFLFAASFNIFRLKRETYVWINEKENVYAASFFFFSMQRGLRIINIRTPCIVFFFLSSILCEPTSIHRFVCMFSIASEIKHTNTHKRQYGQIVVQCTRIHRMHTKSGIGVFGAC